MGDLSLTPDPWEELRGITAARIALGRSGGSVPTRAQLDFRLAHARARDAVLSHFDPDELGEDLRTLGQPVLVAESAARDRAEFLQRPDLGRRLGHASRADLVEHAARGARCDLVIIISDGLSTLAATTQSAPLLAALLPLLHASGWVLAPLVVARHGRVGLQDEIGEIFRAKISLMLLGERPGLGSADSLGAYFTHAPAIGMTDADRNCISNIRPGGLTAAEAAHKLHYLLTQARTLGLSGVALKDDAPMLPTSASTGPLPHSATHQED
ncbi:MAG: ethanolamine ammonia-lyase subunit EutC [Chthoniobacter sp.]|uniref:ethanolamine ammonia-lyase subunit EutC n=1 Tax=Chthoniobacter sp. TaxID=2510640 RepID=UPI0032A2EAA4